MPHARNLLEQTLARTARIDDRVGFGSPTAGICFSGRLAFGFGFVAAMRHDSYKSMAELMFPQLQKDCRIKVPPATPARESNRPQRSRDPIAKTDTEMADASVRIRERRERKERMKVADDELRQLLAERRQFLGSAATIATIAAPLTPSRPHFAAPTRPAFY